jgi:3-oxoacyl-[acyl-carrier-protein] synthase II
MARAGYLKSRPFAGGTLNTEKTPGTYMGEGAAFFVLSHEKTETSYARLRGVCFLSKPDLAELENTLTAFLSSKGLVVSDLSLVMLGNSGDVRFENILETLSTGFFKETAQANFKHLCGEYMTSGSFALWLASTILKGQVPGMLEQIRTNQLPVGPMKHILVVNHFRNMEYSFMLISAC